MSIFEGGFFGTEGATAFRSQSLPPGHPQDTFRIEELAGRRRVLILRGRSLPYRPVTWTTEQRVVTTWYPGNPEATQQILGVREAQMEINGYLRSRYLNAGALSDQGDPALLRQAGAASSTKLDTPEKVRDAMDDIGRSGQAVLVAWASVVRVGRIVKVEFTHDRLEDIGYKITFDWKGRGEKVPRANPLPRGNQRNTVGFLASLLRAGAAAVADLETVLDMVETAKQNVILAMRKVTAAVSRAAALVDRVVGAVRAPIDIVNALIATFVNIRAIVRASADNVASTPAELMSTSDSVFAMLDSYNGIHVTQHSLNLVSRDSYRREQEQLAQIKPQYLDVIVGKAGQSLRDLSRRYYGDPDSWQVIADANGIDGSTLLGGEIVIIPVPK